MLSTTTAKTLAYEVVWEKLPDDFVLPNAPVDNINRPVQLDSASQQNRFWIPEVQLFLGVWQRKRDNRDGYWLRWWDDQGNLLWDTEQIEQERQRVERLAAQLRAAGIEPEL